MMRTLTTDHIDAAWRKAQELSIATLQRFSFYTSPPWRPRVNPPQRTATSIRKRSKLLKMRWPTRSKHAQPRRGQKLVFKRWKPYV